MPYLLLNLTISKTVQIHEILEILFFLSVVLEFYHCFSLNLSDCKVNLNKK